MLIIISPAKNFNLKPAKQTTEYSIPEFLDFSQILVKKLKTFNPMELQELLGINPDLAFLNYNRYIQWETPFTLDNSKQALISFVGEVYRGLQAEKFSKIDLEYAQNHLRVLSGLYGILRPLDLIQPYRLEMGIPLKTKNHTNLYTFWGNKITDSLNRAIEDNNIQTIVHLASSEYFKVINKNRLKAKVITPIFLESKGDANKVIVVYTKKARGLMSSFIIKNRISNPEEIKHFDLEGYSYIESLSNDEKWTFVR
jgi:cytoplasmic iron level regulating protein YaaA (DUF328/UPF0246 family)